MPETPQLDCSDVSVYLGADLKKPRGVLEKPLKGVLQTK